VSGGRLGRRALLAQAALLAGCAEIGPPPLPPASKEDDVAILNSLLALEHAAVAAYDGIADLLGAELAARAAQFREEHASHAEGLAAAIRERGGEPVAPAPFHGVAADAAGALAFLAAEERGLASAYVGAVPAFADRDLARSAASILAVESLHWGAWRSALGEKPSDGAFFSDQKSG
jgi:Ferritin-like domain